MTKRKQTGTVLFSNVITKPSFKGKQSDKFELTITLTPEEALDAENNGLSISRSEYQGNEQVKAKLKSKYQLPKSKFVDRYKNPFIDESGNLREIPRGSRVNVYYNTQEYDMPNGTVVANYLEAIQVIEENSDIDFDDYEEPTQGFEGEF